MLDVLIQISTFLCLKQKAIAGNCFSNLLLFMAKSDDTLRAVDRFDRCFCGIYVPSLSVRIL